MARQESLFEKILRERKENHHNMFNSAFHKDEAVEKEEKDVQLQSMGNIQF